MREESLKRRHFFLLTGLLLVWTYIVHWQALWVPFHYDDFHHIVKNRALHTLQPVRLFTDAGTFSGRPSLRNYRPLLMLSHSLNFSIFGPNPLSFHLVNVVFHLINVVLVAWLVNLITQRRLLAWLSASLFALHPLHTEAVVYISSRSSLMATTFVVLSVGTFCWYRRSHKRLTGVFSAVSFAAALLSKEIGITVLAFILLVDLAFFAQGRRWRRIADISRLHGLFWLIALAYLLIRKILTGAIFAVHPVRSVSDNLLNQSKAVVTYLRLFLFPHGQSVQHDLVETHTALEWGVMGSLLILGLLAGLALWARFAMPTFGAGLLWYAIALSPTSSVVPLYFLAIEHRAYLADIGLSLSMATLLELGWTRFGAWRRYLMQSGILALLLIHSLITAHRIGIWLDPVALWTDAVQKAPSNWMAHNMLGKVLNDEGKMLVLQGRTGAARERFREAEGQLLRGVTQNPNQFQLYVNLGDASIQLGQFDQAISFLSKGIQLNPADPSLYNNLGVAYSQKEAFGEAAAAFQQALKHDANSIEVRYNLAKLIATLSSLGERKQAEAILDGLDRSFPGDPLFLRLRQELESRQ